MAGENEGEDTSRSRSRSRLNNSDCPHHHHSSSKSNPRFLSFVLKALVMALVLFLFFIFIGVAAVLLIHICIAGRALHRRRAAVLFANHDDGVNTGFSPVDLQRLPCFAFGQSASPQICAVCLEGFREGERCRILPRCNHWFHSTCIDTWLSKSSACPVCRGIVSLN